MRESHQQPAAAERFAVVTPSSPALVARGLTNRQVAEQLLVTPRTIETHLEHIFAKLGVQTRTELVAWAVRQDVVVPASR